MKTKVVGVDGVFPYILLGIVDNRRADILIRRVDGKPDRRADIVVTNVRNEERFESLAHDFPNACIALFVSSGGHTIVSGQYKGRFLWEAIFGIFRERATANLEGD